MWITIAYFMTGVGLAFWAAALGEFEGADGADEFFMGIVIAIAWPAFIPMVLVRLGRWAHRERKL